MQDLKFRFCKRRRSILAKLRAKIVVALELNGISPQLIHRIFDVRMRRFLIRIPKHQRGLRFLSALFFVFGINDTPPPQTSLTVKKSLPNPFQTSRVVDRMNLRGSKVSCVHPVLRNRG